MAPESVYIDVTLPLRLGIPTFEGDPGFAMMLEKAIATGANANVSRLDMGVHTGTHIDAPVHFIEGGAGVDQIPPERLIGPAYLVDATSVTGHIDRQTLQQLELPHGARRLLFHTRNSRLWDLPAFSRDFTGLTEDGARYLIDEGVELVGWDYLSVAPFGHGRPTHLALLEPGAVIIEGLDFRGVRAGWYDLLCLPLRLAGSDGGPARVLLRRS